MFASLLGWLLWLASLQAPQPVVRAVLFYSPTCGHCHHVIQEVLPPLAEKYGPQLEIIGVDVTQPQGGQLFQAALQRFQLQSSGVPFLVIGDEYLVGSAEIPEKFPGLIEKHLAKGGIDWPDIPGLAEVLPQPSLTPTFAPTPQITLSPGSNYTPTAEMKTVASTPTPFPGIPVAGKTSPGPLELFRRDPLGNSLSVLTLLGMLAVAGFAAINFHRLTGDFPLWQLWLIPVLALAGLVVAGYLAYVETAQVTAVCGPVGDCNTVQQSEYARLFGFLPIGVLGLAGYLLMMLAWLVGRLKREPLSAYADLALLVMTTFGLCFSLYLTFLEPFVIGATCAWCLTSAVLMTLLFLLSLKPGKLASSSLFR